jgi:hypothetical protein
MIKVWNRKLLANHVIVPTADTMEENPRREGSSGWLSLEVMRANPGMTVAAYMASPVSHLGHLKWDTLHGNVDVNPPAPVVAKAAKATKAAKVIATKAAKPVAPKVAKAVAPEAQLAA